MPKTPESMFLATAIVGGVDRGQFNTKAGGQVRAAMVESRNPTQRYASQIPLRPTIEPITIGRPFDRTRETDVYLAGLRALVGTGENNMVVALWSLDQNLQPFLKVGNWIGTLSEVNEPDTDVDGDGLALFTLVMGPTAV